MLPVFGTPKLMESPWVLFLTKFNRAETGHYLWPIMHLLVHLPLSTYSKIMITFPSKLLPDFWRNFSFSSRYWLRCYTLWNRINYFLENKLCILSTICIYYKCDKYINEPNKPPKNTNSSPHILLHFGSSLHPHHQPHRSGQTQTTICTHLMPLLPSFM